MIDCFNLQQLSNFFNIQSTELHLLDRYTFLDNLCFSSVISKLFQPKIKQFLANKNESGRFEKVHLYLLIYNIYLNILPFVVHAATIAELAIND